MLGADVASFWSDVCSKLTLVFEGKLSLENLFPSVCVVSVNAHGMYGSTYIQLSVESVILSFIQ